MKVAQEISNWPQALKSYRLNRKLTQASLAEMLKVSKRTVEDWEAGKNTPPGYLMYALQALAIPQPISEDNKTGI